ncbi:transcription initiation factor IIA subunit 1-like isoform X2 [Uloborus diversus]|uniref:transcription initiation factor IIA subunit 1-like isoform X2 n=1 Tax=Uloborus diversus TaxID=327109 RepID=UPI0024096377|nr:transcription initiation factor IIA subunit 1-like isoform X2 [Uloborus diversus]
MAASSVPKLYYSVIEDVIASVREAFIDEGVDEQALTELKQVWERKLQESKAIEKEVEQISSKNTTQNALQPVQQQTTSIGGAAITHQLAMPTGNLVPQTLLQYAAPNSGEVQKTMALNPLQKLTLTVPAHLAQSGLQTLVSAAPGTTAVQLPADLASLFQGGQQIANVHYQTLTSEQLKNAQQFTVTIPVSSQSQPTGVIGQLDGADDTSDDDDEDDFQDNDDDRDDDNDEQIEDDQGEEDEEPLNSDDDVSEDDPTDLFDTENVVVCQYDKITRSKNRWKFHLKDGIMNLQGKDFVFQKALGDSEW